MIKFQAKIGERDLFRYNMHYAYTSSQGIISIVCSIMFYSIVFYRWAEFSTTSRFVYLMVATLFLVYMPMTLKMKAKATANTEVFMEPLSYELTDTGVVVSSPTAQEPAELPYEYIYKVATWKEYLLIYSNRVNAYIIPKEAIIDQYPQIKEQLQAHIKEFKLSLKW